MNYDKLTQKKKELDIFRPLPRELVNNLDDWFRVELTYTSNAIEGNTLTRRETAVVIEKGITVGGRCCITKFAFLFTQISCNTDRYWHSNGCKFI